MKIGILSMQKIPNYGSFLQALSLKKQFEKRGHDVYFIDIIPGKTVCEAHYSKVGLLSKFDKYFFKRIENYFLFKKMATIHTDDHQRYLETLKVLPAGEKFDLAIIGSDEVFNAAEPSRWGFTTQLFGDVKNADRVVCYAASCGGTTFDKVNALGIVDEIAEAMKRMEYISVRDSNTFNFVQEITGKTPELNVDPVFITDFDEHIPTIKRKKPYMLVYAYGNRICDEKEIGAIKAYAKKNKLEIVSVGMQQRWCKHNIAATAFELLAYVKGASCIVTDTFHGTVFSIKYNKRFATIIRDSNKNKLGGLLKQFDLLERSVTDTEQFEDILDKNINYEVINQTISNEQKKSYDYLEKVLKAD